MVRVRCGQCCGQWVHGPADGATTFPVTRFFFLPTRPKEFVYITDNLYAIMNFISRRIAPLWLVLLECVLLSTAEEGRLDYLLYNVLKYNTAVSCSVIVLIIDEKCAVGLLGCLIIGY